MKKRHKHHIPTAIWMILIFIISSIPGAYLQGYEIKNIIGHFVEYFVLAYLIHRVEKNNKITFIIAFIYGVLDEFHQLFVPGRICDIFDLFVDTLGIIFSIKVYNLITQKSYKLRKIQK